MASGSASYSVSATNYGAKVADSYFILSAPDTINGPLHITGNLTVDGTSQLTGAVNCGASLTVADNVTALSITAGSGGINSAGAVVCGASVTVGGGLAVSGNVMLGSGPGGVVNLVPSVGSVNILGGGGALVVGDNTDLGTSIGLNGTVGTRNLNVAGNLTAAGNVVATGSVGASVIGATTGSLGSLTVGGGSTAAANTLLANFPASLLGGIANMGTGLIYPSSGTNNQTGSIVFGNLLINWGQGSSDADGIFAASFTVPYPVHGPGGDPGKDPMVFCATYNFDNGYQVYGTVLQRTRTGVRIQGQSPTTGTHVGAGFSLGYLAIGPVV